MKKTLFSLQEYGLSPTESLIYMSLLQTGASSILDISRKTKLNRSTAHLNVDSLINIGLVTQMQRGNKRVIIAEPPERLSYLLDQEKNKIKRKEDNLKSVISNVYDEIDNVKENTSSQVKYYEGVKSISKLYDKILESDEVRAYVNPVEISRTFPENHDKFFNAAKKGKVKLWDIQTESNDSREFAAKYSYPTYNFKFFPANINISSMDYLMYDGNLCIVENKGIPIAINLQNDIVYRNSVNIFKLIWELLPNQ